MQIWQNQAVTDGFAGNTVNAIQLGTSWAHVKNVRRDLYTDYGLNGERQAIEVLLRHRNDLDYFQQDIFLRYDGRDWAVSSVQNSMLDDIEIRIIAVA